MFPYLRLSFLISVAFSNTHENALGISFFVDKYKKGTVDEKLIYLKKIGDRVINDRKNFPKREDFILYLNEISNFFDTQDKMFIVNHAQDLIQSYSKSDQEKIKKIMMDIPIDHKNLINSQLNINIQPHSEEKNMDTIDASNNNFMKFQHEQHPKFLKNMEKIHITSADQLNSIDSFNNLKEIELSDITNPISLGFLLKIKCLKKLIITNCNFEQIPILSDTSIEEIIISECEKFSKIAGIDQIKKLKKLYIVKCPLFLSSSIPKSFDPLKIEEVFINNCPQFTHFSPISHEKSQISLGKNEHSIG